MKLDESTKDLELTVTPFRRKCSSSYDYFQCGNKCIRKELFCNGQVNCGPIPGYSLPLGE